MITTRLVGGAGGELGITAATSIVPVELASATIQTVTLTTRARGHTVTWPVE